MDKTVNSKNIHNKTVSVILVFDKYKEKQYQQDFKEIMAYHKKLTEEDASTLNYKFFGIKNLEYIPYNEFRNITSTYFSKIVFYLLEQNPEFMMVDDFENDPDRMITKEFNIIIRLLTTKVSQDCFDHKEKESDPETVVYTAPGSWYLQNIAAPIYYSRHVQRLGGSGKNLNLNFEYVMRYFLHELTHHKEQMKEFLKNEKKNIRKIKIVSKDYDMYNLNHLHTSVVNLRMEGSAEFNARANNTIQDINMNGIRAYKENMRIMLTIKSKWKATHFYLENIGFNNIGPTGENANGRYMCLIIALYLATVNNLEYYIIVNRNNITPLDIKSKKYNMDSILSSNDIVKIALSQPALSNAKKAISSTEVVPFIRLYEDACKYLGISEKNQVISMKRYAEMVDIIKRNR